jgi:HSP20 family molecular chaperone IbpA
VGTWSLIVPGVCLQDIKVTVDGDVLTLAVQKEAGTEEQKEEGGWKVHRVERSSSFARRSLRMPPNADLRNIKVHSPDR